MTIDEKALVRAVKRAMDGAGTPAARDAVKLWPSDWHLICDLVLNPPRQAAKQKEAGFTLSGIKVVIDPTMPPDAIELRSCNAHGDVVSRVRALLSAGGEG